MCGASSFLLFVSLRLLAPDIPDVPVPVCRVAGALRYLHHSTSGFGVGESTALGRYHDRLPGKTGSRCYHPASPRRARTTDIDYRYLAHASVPASPYELQRKVRIVGPESGQT